MTPAIYPYPYSADELAAMVPRPNARWWTALAVLAGGAAAVLAFTPVGPASAVPGGIGIAAGILALRRAGRFWAVTGTVISSVAVAVTIVTTLARLLGAPDPPAAAAAVNTDVAAVLADELEVRFGPFTDSRVFPELTVALTNKRGVVRQCDLEIGAFAASGQQISSARVTQENAYFGGIVLAAHATADTTAEFLTGGNDEAEQQLSTATFRVITVACGPFDYVDGS